MTRGHAHIYIILYPWSDISVRCFIQQPSFSHTQNQVRCCEWIGKLTPSMPSRHPFTNHWGVHDVPVIPTLSRGRFIVIDWKWKSLINKVFFAGDVWFPVDFPWFSLNSIHASSIISYESTILPAFSAWSPVWFRRRLGSRAIRSRSSGSWWIPDNGKLKSSRFFRTSHRMMIFLIWLVVWLPWI